MDKNEITLIRSVSIQRVKSILAQLIALLSSSLWFACAPKPPVREYGPYANYVVEFERNSSKYTKEPVVVENLRIITAPLEADRMASCTLSEHTVPTITVNPDVWEELTDAEKRNVMNHELGHCILGRQHKDELTEEGLPLSLMNSRALDPVLYEINEDYYVYELYQKDVESASKQKSVSLRNALDR